MMFGTMPMSLEGRSSKMHFLPSLDLVLITRLVTLRLRQGFKVTFAVGVLFDVRVCPTHNCPATCLLAIVDCRHHAMRSMLTANVRACCGACVRFQIKFRDFLLWHFGSGVEREVDHLLRHFLRTVLSPECPTSLEVRARHTPSTRA
jgi:hypothetical protein